jgi:hypothetical protein
MVVVEGERRVYWMYAITIGITVMSLVDVDAHRSMLASCPNRVASCPNRVAAQPGVSLNSSESKPIIPLGPPYLIVINFAGPTLYS